MKHYRGFTGFKPIKSEINPELKDFKKDIVSSV
jgi:hypothetical protein